MDGRTGALLACSVLALAAGCVGVGGDEEAATASNASALEPSNATDRAGPGGASAPASSDPSGSTLVPGARPAANGTNATDLRVAEVTLDDPARLAGFTWTVPEEAVVEYPGYPVEDPPETVVLRGTALLDGSASRLEAWSLLAFDLGGDTAEPLSTTVASPVTVEVWNPAPPETGEREVEPHPFVATLGFGDLEPGDTVGLVLAARGQAGTPFGVAVQPVVEPAPDEYPEPPEGLGELRDGASATVALPRQGSGEGLHVGTYTEWTFPVRPYRSTLWTPGVEVEDRVPADQPPGASARSTTIRSSFAADGGWATASGFAWGDLQAGRWASSMDVHGVEVDAEGPVAQSLGTSDVSGPPYARATGGGPGGSEARFTLETGGVGQLVFFHHLALGEPLETLVGQPAEEDHVAIDTTPEPVAWRTADDQWTLAGGPGPSLTLLGVPLPPGDPARPG